MQTIDEIKKDFKFTIGMNPAEVPAFLLALTFGLEIHQTSEIYKSIKEPSYLSNISHNSISNNYFCKMLFDIICEFYSGASYKDEINWFLLNNAKYDVTEQEVRKQEFIEIYKLRYKEGKHILYNSQLNKDFQYQYSIN